MEKDATLKNKVILFAAFIILNGFVQAQSFEGKIVYSNHFTSKMANISNEQLGAIIGTRQDYFIKGGNYKSIFNGQAIVMQLYDHKTNRVYNQKNKSDTLFWFDASINTDQVFSFELKKNALEVLGYICDAIIMNSKSGQTTIYYSNRISLDVDRFKNHHYSNWSFYTEKTKAVPLKTVIETNTFRMESIAIDIQNIQLKDEIFQEDKVFPIKKSN